MLNYASKSLENVGCQENNNKSLSFMILGEDLLSFLTRHRQLHLFRLQSVGEEAGKRYIQHCQTLPRQFSSGPASGALNMILCSTVAQKLAAHRVGRSAASPAHCKLEGLQSTRIN